MKSVFISSLIILISSSLLPAQELQTFASLYGGVTLYSTQAIYDRYPPTKKSNIGLNYNEIRFGFYDKNVQRFGIEIGKDTFMDEYKNYYGENDTRLELNNKTWIALFYERTIYKNFNLGADIGISLPENYYSSISAGQNFDLNENIIISWKLAYKSAGWEEFAKITDKGQLGFYTGFGVKW